MKKCFAYIMIFVVIMITIQYICASGVFTDEIGKAESEQILQPDRSSYDNMSPMNGDMINIIIFMLCTSGAVLIVFFILAVVAKNK